MFEYGCDYRVKGKQIWELTSKTLIGTAKSVEQAKAMAQEMNNYRWQLEKAIAEYEKGM